MYVSKKIIALVLLVGTLLAPLSAIAMTDEQLSGPADAASQKAEAGANGISFSFAVISDTPELNTDVQGEALINVVPFINEKKPDFVVLLGDLAYKGSAAQYTEFNKAFLSKLEIPVVPVAGNHDFLNGHSPWYTFWGNQSAKLFDPYKTRTTCGPNSPYRFSSFSYKGQGFVLIDPYFDGHHYWLSQQELDCLDSNMVAGDLVFRHVTPYGLSCAKDGSVCGSSVLGKSNDPGKNGEVQDFSQLTQKLISKNAKALFAGHTHANYHGTCDGLEYINSGTMGKQMMEYTKGQTSSDVADSFAWVDVGSNGKITVTMYIYDDSSKTFAPQTKNYPATVTSQTAKSQHDGEMEAVNATCTSIQPDGSSGAGAGGSGTPGVVQEIKTYKPDLAINIPQLQFSDVQNSLVEINGVSYLTVPYIGEYLSAAYKVALVAMSIIAVIMIIIQGVKITTIGGEERIHGFQKIGQVIIGLFIGWGSYSILYTINPDLVNFNALKIRYIAREEIPSSSEGTGYEGADNATYNGQYDSKGLELYPKVGPSAKCLMGAYDLHVGVQPPSVAITFLGAKFKINPKAVAAFKQVEKEILESPEPEMKDYVKFFQGTGKDSPSLHTYPKKPHDRASSGISEGLAGEHCGFGYARKKATCEVNDSVTKDMHQAAMAVDLIYGSNQDFKYDGSKNTGSAITWCNQYKENYEKQKDEFKKYAGLAERIEKGLNDCLNSRFADGSNPFTTHPKKWIDIFKKNGFVWGGDFCNTKAFRTDGMHFEYWGVCKEMRCDGRP